MNFTFFFLYPFLSLVEEATNGDPCSPDTRTMTRIAKASFGIDDFWRIVDILHRKYVLILY